jgi:hypothetical protein
MRMVVQILNKIRSFPVQDRESTSNLIVLSCRASKLVIQPCLCRIKHCAADRYTYELW